MTRMTMPALTKRWDKVKELIDSEGLTIVSRVKDRHEWVITFEQDLNQGQKTAFEAKLTHTVSGIDWS